MTVYHNYVLVLGRIPGDDDDCGETFSQVSEQEAKAAFAHELYAQRYPEEQIREAQAEAERQHGCQHGVFINGVFASQSPIEPILGEQDG